jgi:7-cyano-7-deazaguanine synthase
MPEKSAVVLLSGGLDSATTLACAMAEGYNVYALTFNYGQRHARELVAARELVNYFLIKDHKLVNTDLNRISDSALLNETQELPENRSLESISTEIPSTYVPARNMIMLSYAMAWAESVGADAVFIGVNAIDYSGYPDCREEFIRAFEHAAKLGTKSGAEGKTIKIKYPLINMTKAEIIKRGSKLGVPFRLTWSCYKGGTKACGKCDSCQLRLKGFSDAGLNDEIDYEIKCQEIES